MFDAKAYNREWYQRNKERIREKKRLNMQRYRNEKPEKYRNQSRQSKYRLKQKVFDTYGRFCVICGFGDIRALTLDHINNNGAEERKILGERGVYRRAVEKYRPDEYRIICMNCQFIKRVEARRVNQYSSSG